MLDDLIKIEPDENLYDPLGVDFVDDFVSVETVTNSSTKTTTKKRKRKTIIKKAITKKVSKPISDIDEFMNTMRKEDIKKCNENKILCFENLDGIIAYQFKLVLQKHKDEIARCTYVNVNGKKFYRCDFCQNIINTARNLLIHRSGHTNEKLFTCKICSESMSLVTDLKRHMIQEHLEAEKNVEHKTELELEPKDSTSQEQATVLDNNDAKDEDPVSCYNAKNSNTPNQYKCALCNKTFKQKQHMRRHIRQIHMKLRKYPCTLCTLKFQTRMLLLEHFKEIHNSESRDPDVLQKQRKLAKRIKNDALIQESLIKSDETYAKIGFKCLTCNVVLKNRNRFMEHQSIHTGEFSYCCDICGKTFRLQSSLKRHLDEVHLKIKHYNCDHCDLKFYSYQGLQKHLNTHTDNRPYVCETCGKAYRQSAALYSHKRSHEDRYPFVCDLCPKKYKNSYCLKVHYRQHVGDRPYVCELCQADFTYKGGLREHMQIHSSKMHACVLCGNKYKLKSSLRTHIRNHHRSKDSITSTSVNNEVAQN